MRQSLTLALTCGAIALVCLVSGGLFFAERPTLLRVAIPKDDVSDIDLLSAASKVVRHGRHPIRFKTVSVDDPKAASEQLDSGHVDMAIVRTDGPMPAQGQTVVILHRDAAVLIAPGGSLLKGVADLADHTIGIVEPADADQALLDTILAQYDVDKSDVKIVNLPVGSVSDAVKAKTVDAVFVVGILSDTKVQETVAAVEDATDDPSVFLAIPDAAAISQRSPGIDTFEVVKGAFHGSPPQPAEEFDTLSVTHRLVASTALSDSVVADVTRFFLSERSALVAADPIARRIEAPPTDKGNALPAHPGTAAYIDDEEETFLDHYSDLIYLGAMIFGVLASGATAVFSRLNARGVRAVEILTARLLEIMKLVRFAPSLDLVNALEAETDEIVATALEQDNARSLDERRLSALGLALDQVREAIRDRRAWLAGTAPAGDTPRLIKEQIFG